MCQPEKPYISTFDSDYGRFGIAICAGKYRPEISKPKHSFFY